MARRRGAAGAEGGNPRKNGKAIAMAGWGHPFFALVYDREVERARLYRGPAAAVTLASGAVLVRGGRVSDLIGARREEIQRAPALIGR